MSIVAIFNQKGGVGKTTTSLNLAAGLARKGRKVLAIDLDPQAQLSEICGIQPGRGEETVFGFFQKAIPLAELIQPSEIGISIIPANAELAKVDSLFGKGHNVVNRLNVGIQKEALVSKGDMLVIDCCPMIGVLSLNALFACDSLIVPISADYLSLKGALRVEKALKALEQVWKKRLPRRYLLNRFDIRRKMARDIMRQLEERFGGEVCRTRSAENVSLAESPALNKDVFTHAPGSRGSEDYEALLEELLGDGFID
ncbi:MAG: ParA family protein [Betaproteobacteria bacterium]